jgi:predicted transposase YdaD
MTGHDALYHRLFSHPGMVAQLLRDFVAETWLGELDLDGMERINAKFHAGTGERRESDVVWRIPMQGGRDAYILLMLEFQSTQERWMALRVMVYVGLLWQHLIHEGRIAGGDRLPPVLPIVIYNGDPRWAMPLCYRR